jgi:hypothetical protein
MLIQPLHILSQACSHQLESMDLSLMCIICNGFLIILGLLSIVKYMKCIVKRRYQIVCAHNQVIIDIECTLLHSPRSNYVQHWSHNSLEAQNGYYILYLTEWCLLTPKWGFFQLYQMLLIFYYREYIVAIVI